MEVEIEMIETKAITVIETSAFQGVMEEEIVAEEIVAEEIVAEETVAEETVVEVVVEEDKEEVAVLTVAVETTESFFWRAIQDSNPCSRIRSPR